MAKKKAKKKEPKKSKSDDNSKKIDSTLKELEKKFGEGAIMKLGETPDMDVKTISTGSIGLDEALGVGGLPRGRVVEIYGPEASGKTTLALHCVAEAQKAGGVAAFIDAEHALDPIYAKNIGVDTDNLLLSQPNSGEQALDIVESLVRSGNVDIIVIDSVAALTPRDEIEGEMGDHHVGKQARLMSQALRKLTSITNKSKTIVVFINQIRMKIGVMFGSPEVTPGGRALKFYCSVRLDIRRRAQIKKGDEAVGSRAKVKVVKNKVASPFRETEFDIMYGEGISREGEIIALGEKYDVIERAGAYYKYEDETLGQGYDNTRQYLLENKKEAAKILKEIKEEMKKEI
ncbi:MAG: recombinase RecA [Candidatus Paceibacterota bacterium]